MPRDFRRCAHQQGNGCPGNHRYQTADKQMLIMDFQRESGAIVHKGDRPVPPPPVAADVPSTSPPLEVVLVGIPVSNRKGIMTTIATSSGSSATAFKMRRQSAGVQQKYRQRQR